MSVLLLARPPVAGAQDEPRVLEVRVEQEGRPVTDPALLSLIETRAGQPLAMREVRSTITHLASLDRFDDARVFQLAIAGGIALRWELFPLHPVDRVELRGSPGLDPNELRRILADRFGPAPSANRAEEVAEALRMVYRTRGYPSAQVTAKVEETHDPDRATLALDVTAGRRAIIRGVRMLQVDAEGTPTIDERPAIREGESFDEPSVLRALGRWEARYRERGYYEARATHGVSFVDGDAVVSVNLSRGPRVVVEFAGDALSEADRERLVPVRTEGSADEDLLEDAARAIEDELLTRGYRDAEARFERMERDGELHVVFTIARGPRYVVSSVVISGNSALADAELEPLVRIKPKDVFVQTRLDDARRAVEAAYRLRGFARVQVAATMDVADAAAAGPDRLVDARFAVTEGPRTTVRSVTFEGQMALSVAELQKAANLGAGRPFSAAEVESARDAIARAYRDRGYDGVAVQVGLALLENDSQADVSFTIREGAQVLVDHVIIVGNERTALSTIEQELTVREGQPLGASALAESRVRLAALGVFRRIQIETIAHGTEPRRDVLVRVEESPPTTLGFGGGLEGGYRLRAAEEGGQAEERIEFAPRGFFQIGRRNLWGKNRQLNLFTRASLRSRDITGTTGVLTSEGGYGFNEYRVVGTFREPRAFQTRAEVLVTGIFEQAIRSSFNFIRREARAEAGYRLSPVYTVTGRYSFQNVKLLDERFTPDEEPIIDRLFPQVRISRFAASVLRDTRDSVVDSTRGALLIADGDLAARAIGSEVGFVKLYVQGSFFRRLQATRRAVFAHAARLGLAHGFSREVEGVVVQDLPASERFFAGGEYSVRGFALDRLGGPETIGPNGFPTGGNGVIVLLNELRVALRGAWEGVGFFDIGNVFLKASDLDLTDLRPSAGAGVRYLSPFGPIRFDWGFNLDPLELPSGFRERSSVWHFSLGQAF
jgi:outer membrane protein assembly factor BamA